LGKFGRPAELLMGGCFGRLHGPFGEWIAEGGPLFRPHGQFSIIEQALPESLQHFFLGQFLADVNELLTAVAVGLLPIFHDGLHTFVIIGPTGFPCGSLGALRGLLDNRVPLIANAVCYWGLSQPTVYLLVFVLDWGAFGVWVGYLPWLVLTGLFFLARFVQRTKVPV